MAVATPTPAQTGGWPALFKAAFTASRNGMALVDEQRRHVEANGAYLNLLGYRRDELVGRPMYDIVAGGPIVSPGEWDRLLHERRFSGEAGLICANGSVVGVQFGGTPEVVTGHQLVLFVALSTSRWGRHFRRDVEDIEASGNLSPREFEIVRLVALGRTGPEIADELHISHGTVRTHVRNAMDKVGARSRAHLVAKALGEGSGLG